MEVYEIIGGKTCNLRAPALAALASSHRFSSKSAELLGRLSNKTGFPTWEEEVRLERLLKRASLPSIVNWPSDL